jgi:hypothetical protein
MRASSWLWTGQACHSWVIAPPGVLGRYLLDYVCVHQAGFRQGRHVIAGSELRQAGRSRLRCVSLRPRSLSAGPRRSPLSKTWKGQACPSSAEKGLETGAAVVSSLGSGLRRPSRVSGRPPVGLVSPCVHWARTGTRVRGIFVSSFGAAAALDGRGAVVAAASFVHSHSLQVCIMIQRIIGCWVLLRYYSTTLHLL